MNENDDIDLILDSSPDALDDTHESLIIQGSLDALEGTESYAVRYLGGCLAASDMLPMNVVHGNESVWSSIKSGYVKSITYIKNFFRGIYNFFFGKESDAKDEKENEALESEKSLLAKLPSGAELSATAQSAINSAAEKAKDMGKKISDKVKASVDAAKIYAEDKQLKEKLDSALEKLSDITDKAVEASKKQVKGIALAVQIRMSIWLMYYRDFRGVMSSQVKALAAKTQAEIDKLEQKIKSAGESGVENLKEKLASLKEVMKSYTSIQQLKTSFRSFITGVVNKLKPSYFTKKEA